MNAQRPHDVLNRNRLRFGRVFRAKTQRVAV
jgi:hypothetical protein